MKPSDITVVIPTYKRPRFLARSLESVLQQDVRGLRIRVVDNASGDETEQVVRELGRRQPIEYVCHPTNIGMAANLAFAIDSVDTPWCAILNDDDLHLPGLIEGALSALPQHPDAAAFCGRMLQYRGTDYRPLFLHGSTWDPGFYRSGTTTHHMVLEHFPPTGVIYASRALQTARMGMSDRSMMARFAEANGFVVTDKILGAIVVHQQGWSSSQSRERVRHLLLDQLMQYLELTTLSDLEKIDIVLAMCTKLLENELKGALGALHEGDVARDALARSAAGLSGIDLERSLAKRTFYRLAATVARSGRGALSRPTAAAVRAGWRIARGFERLDEIKRDLGPAARDALVEVSALDRKADAFYADFQAATTKPGR